MSEPVIRRISPQLTDEDFVKAINAIAGTGESAERFAAALDAVNEDQEGLLTALRRLAGDSDLSHVEDYLTLFPYYVPVFFGVMRAIADPAGPTLELVVVDEGQAADLTLVVGSGKLTLSVLSTNRTRG